MTINRKLRGIRDPVDPGYILGRPKNMGKGPAVQLKAPPGLLTPQQGVDVLGGLPASGVTAGSYTNANVTVNVKGLITAIGNGSAGSLPALNDGQIWIGNATNVAVARTPSGDVTVSDTGVTALGNTTVTAGSYSAANITVDAKGRITAAASGTTGIKAMRVTSDHARSGNTTYADETELKWAVAANEVWLFDFCIFFNSPTAADFKITLSTPSGASFTSGVHALINNITAPEGTAYEYAGSGGDHQFIGGPGTTFTQMLLYRGCVANGANAGNCTVQWAQQVSDAGNTTVFTNSSGFAIKQA